MIPVLWKKKFLMGTPWLLNRHLFGFHVSKKILCAMPKVHHLFFLHRMVKHRNNYTVRCYKNGRKPLLPKARGKLCWHVHLQSKNCTIRESSFNMTRGGWRYWNLKLEILAAPSLAVQFFRSPPSPVGFEVNQFWEPPLIFSESPFGFLKIFQAPLNIFIPPPPTPCHIKWTFPYFF